jgi:membrane-associated phospholipid phosphatase
VVAAAVCYLLMVRTSLGQRFDDAAYLGAQHQAPGLAAADRSQLERITADSFALVLLALVAIGLLRRRFLLGLGAAVAAGVAVVGTDLLKDRLLTRPDLAGSFFVRSNTFPSGHTATAVACAMALILVCPPRWRGVAAVVAGGYGWVTAAQVQTAGWHRPSDAIGAALLAFAAVTAVGAVLAWTRPVSSVTESRHLAAQTVLGLVGLVDLAFVVWGLLTVLRYLHAHALGLAVPDHLRDDAYITGMTITIGVVVLLLMILLALVGRVDLGGWGWARRPARPGRPNA